MYKVYLYLAIAQSPTSKHHNYFTNLFNTSLRISLKIINYTNPTPFNLTKRKINLKYDYTQNIKLIIVSSLYLAYNCFQFMKYLSS